MEKQTTQEYEKAIAYIIDRIKEGSLQLGSKLPPERRIAEELGMCQSMSASLSVSRLR